jgi:protocatechuate 3,4-dioxygenase, beta subunit
MEKPLPRGWCCLFYHTDQNGKYTNKYNEKGWAGRQGYIRGWMKTNEKGQYRFYTLKPASYPNSTAVKHIHPVIKEPGKNEYWIDEFIFDDGPFLTAEKRKEHQQQGGNGIIILKNINGILVGERNIYPGKNIPDYPTALNKAIIKTKAADISFSENPFILSSLIPNWEIILQ